MRTVLSRLAVVSGLALALPFATGCTAATGSEETLTGAPEPEDGIDLRETESLMGSIPAGQQLKTTADLNLRTSPSTSAKILKVIPKGTVVTAVSGTAKNGWYNIRAGSTEGWSYGVYLDKVSSSGGGGGGGGGGGTTGIASCAPSRAIGVVSASKKALLDTIAFAEGTRGVGQDGYNILFAYKTIDDCNTHPNRTVCSGSYCSTAAGRYQFLTTTWNGLKLPNFRPENQTTGAMTLISWRKGVVPSNRAMTATEFTNLMNKISYEWASLPPGRYGQPIKTMSQLRTEYCKLAGC